MSFDPQTKNLFEDVMAQVHKKYEQFSRVADIMYDAPQTARLYSEASDLLQPLLRLEQDITPDGKNDKDVIEQFVRLLSNVSGDLPYIYRALDNLNAAYDDFWGDIMYFCDNIDYLKQYLLKEMDKEQVDLSKISQIAAETQDLDLKYKAQKMREASQKINQQNQQEIVEKSNTSSENSI